MIKILEIIQAKLKQIDERSSIDFGTLPARIYRDQVPRGTKTPYVVWGVPNIADLADQEEWDLEITVFDYGDDADEAWIIAERIDEGLKRENVVEAGILVRFLRQNRRMIPDPDPKLQRMELNYTARIYNGN